MFVSFNVFKIQSLCSSSSTEVMVVCEESVHILIDKDKIAEAVAATRGLSERSHEARFFTHFSRMTWASL